MIVLSTMTQLHYDIADYINAKAGGHVQAHEIAAHFKLATERCTRHLGELALANLIAIKGSQRVRSYCMVPKPKPLDEWKAASTKPLTVDKHRRELYARLAADRENIRSIG